MAYARRVAIFAASLFLCIVFTHARALALMEYCGAEVEATPVSAGSSSASTYAFVLSAHTARTVSGHLSIHASDGSWYGASLPEMRLVANTQRFANMWTTFTRVDYQSSPVYTRFPSRVTVSGAYFDSITVFDELVMGWDSNVHSCPGRDSGLDDPSLHSIKALKLLNPAPTSSMSPGAAVIDAQRISAPGQADCAVPFGTGGIVKAVAPDFPLVYRNITQQYQTIVEVAINASGGIDDMWVFAPSGIPALDTEALKSARASTYAPARAFCRDVPTIYLYRAQFNP